MMKQFVRFCVVGLSNTFLSYLLNMAVLWFIRDKGWHYDYIVASLTAFVLCTLWSYFWNNGYVFKAREDELRDTRITIIKTYIMYGFTGICLNNILLWLWVDKFGISKIIAPWLNPAFTVAFTYLVSKFWIYRYDGKGSIKE